MNGIAKCMKKNGVKRKKQKTIVGRYKTPPIRRKFTNRLRHSMKMMDYRKPLMICISEISGQGKELSWIKEL